MMTIAWIGSFLLAVCGLPQAVKCLREKNSKGLSWGFLLCWFFGEICLLIYVIPMLEWALIFNYSFNIFLIFPMLYYKIWPKELSNDHRRS